MQKRIYLKLISIIVATVMLMVPLLMVQEMISERQGYRYQAIQDIATKRSGQQVVAGPFLKVPWRYNYQTKQWNKEKTEYQLITKTRKGSLLVTPEKLSADSNVSNQSLSRGIYQIPIYLSDIGLSGHFTNQALLNHADWIKREHNTTVHYGAPEMTLLTSDPRGIKRLSSLSWNNQRFEFAPGGQINRQYQGVKTQLKPLSGQLRDYQFNLKMELRGMEQLQLVPTGRQSEISMTSDWPHPSFNGRQLPDTREVTETGFSAHWSTSPYDTDIAQVLSRCQQEQYCELNNYAVGAEFIQPVDQYLQAERSSKYGLLFIALTFMAFFLFEVLKKLAIHPIQYGMVGLSLTVFYLLLVSLSEHLGFVTAYISATAATALLLATYLSAILRSKLRGISFATAISLLYGVLYMIISSEDFALLMGTSLIFAALAAIMLLTRKIDWYQLTPGTKNAPAKSESEA